MNKSEYRKVYPVMIEKVSGPHPYIVHIPDFEIVTEGDDLYDAILMARDAIGFSGLDNFEDGSPFPEPSEMDAVLNQSEIQNPIITLVDIDFDEYRKRAGNFAVKKTLTIPSWLNVRAEAAGPSFSAILQSGVKEALGISQER